jgi:hypothetical protein
MKHEIGSRVFAISHSTCDSIYLYGFGVYEGDFVPVEAAGWLAKSARELEHKNPRTRLDSGEVVYGCECYWGQEAQFAKISARLKIVNIDIAEARRGCK